jgi:eukaryotic-like serine/threonine-protein kinase
MSDETTKRIGDYEILKELGAGGMGKVYQVRNVITDRIEAMKALLPDLVSTQDLAARFLREVKLTASLDHPNICALRTAFSNDNRLYMVMEYVEGTTLATKLDMGPLSVNEAVKYIGQVLGAVSYAHQRHIIHRDIKPANMMLTTQGVIKLMDFGIARSGDERGLTMTGTTLGSIGYMSPEQVKGDSVDARSDLYSVGIVLYEFVTSRRPFMANSEYSIMAAHLNQAPTPPLELNPELPAALNEIILMAIAKDPAKRFQTADAFANALTTVPACSAVAPAVSRTPLAGTTGGDTQRPAGFWEASPTLEKPSAHRSATGTVSPIPAYVPAATATTPMPATATTPMPATATTPMPATATNPMPATATTPLAAATPLPPTAPLSAAAVPQPAAGLTPASATPVPMPPPSQGSGHRGLYMTLGALIVLAVLVVAGIYVPRISKTNAKAPDASGVTATDTGSQSPVQPTQPPAADSSPAGATSPGSTAQPGAPVATTASVDTSAPMPSPQAPTAATPAPKEMNPAQPSHPRGKKLTAQNNGVASDSAMPAQSDGGTAAPAAASDSANFDQMETELDQLSNRAAAVNSSLDRLQQQQSASGFGLRGDMVAKQVSMKGNLSKAEDAVQRHDAARAKRYLELTGRDVEALEKFLGH